jgi:hypothetical protein
MLVKKTREKAKNGVVPDMGGADRVYYGQDLVRLFVELTVK